MRRSSGHISEAQNLLLEVEQIHVHYGKAEIIKGVSFQVRNGEAVSLIGSNGAGKTTILRAITGYKTLTSGEVKFSGEVITGHPPHEIAKMGIAHVLEGKRIFPSLSVDKNLQAGSFLLQKNEETAKIREQILATFPQLKARLKQEAGTLSGGEQQMLVIARALMAKPILLILDEPSAGLSPLMVQEVGRLVRHINQRGVDILIVEQNSYLAFNTSARSYVLETGAVVISGSTQDLMQDDRVRKAYLST
jgi:branched-chain amino acid transport system ATP-binding protein